MEYEKALAGHSRRGEMVRLDNDAGCTASTGATGRDNYIAGDVMYLYDSFGLNLPVSIPRLASVSSPQDTAYGPA